MFIRIPLLFILFVLPGLGVASDVGRVKEILTYNSIYYREIGDRFEVEMNGDWVAGDRGTFRSGHTIITIERHRCDSGSEVYISLSTDNGENFRALEAPAEPIWFVSSVILCQPRRNLGYEEEPKLGR